MFLSKYIPYVGHSMLYFCIKGDNEPLILCSVLSALCSVASVTCGDLQTVLCAVLS